MQDHSTPAAPASEAASPGDGLMVLAQLTAPPEDDRAVAIGAIRDGTQVLGHDGYDVDAYARVAREMPRLREAAQRAGERLPTAPALQRDVWWSFHKPAPRIAPPAPLTPAHELNRLVLEQLMSTREWAHVRLAGTVDDPAISAMAALASVEQILGSLDEATVARYTELHALEGQIRGLVAQADVLTEGAGADPARADELFRQAASARQQAEAAAARYAAVAQELAATSEERADAVRRAARQVLPQVERQIDVTLAAIKAFGGGYGVGPGGAGAAPAPLTVKEKLALAQRVMSNPKLLEIARLAGRLTRIAMQVQASRVDHPPDEVTAIGLGADLTRVLPSETVLLAEPDLEELFWARYLDRRLAVYDLIGHEPQGRGPVILAVDNSGSMSGPREVWSKAVALALLAIAGRQRRDMAVIHFGGDARELKLFRFPKGQASPSETLACCGHWYGGGTAYEPWMAAALRLIDEATFDRADVIFVSDGEVAIDPAARAAWQQRRQARGMRVFAILIGGEAGAGVLASIADALLCLDSLAADGEVLQTIFSI
ncbi:MAG: hypothetical protein IT340_22065 [Chloroflexi bacterium]|nr:hypothetical protein [Chloroflexota bacterium]